jgi:hypothetical protein
MLRDLPVFVAIYIYIETFKLPIESKHIETQRVGLRLGEK